jgi:hypothetical protein
MELRKPDPPDFSGGKHWDADKLERKLVAEYLTRLVTSITQPFVISLASDYGTGKTFFIECWRKDLAAVQFNTVYFNAWKTDFSQDALFAVISAMKRELSHMIGADKKFNEAAKKAGALTARKFLPLAAKIVGRVVLGEDATKEVLQTFGTNEEEVSSALGEIAEDRLKAQESAEKSLEDFRSYIEQILSDLTSAQPDELKRKVIVFVDDLDRCRPDYAVAVLECIKHLFSVPGLVFVLSVDERQLYQAVASVYGPNIDADGYLRRFIDWQFRLPTPSTIAFSRFLVEKYRVGDLKEFQIRNDFGDPEMLALSIGIFSGAFGFSLRRIEHCFIEVNLALRTTIVGYIPYAPILGVASVLRHRYPNELRDCLSGKMDAIDFLYKIEPALKDKDFADFYGDWNQTRSILFSWFISSEQASQIDARIKKINGRMGSMNTGNINGYSDSEESLILTLALDLWRSNNAQVRLSSKSLMHLCYDRLEGTPLLSLR